MQKEFQNFINEREIEIQKQEIDLKNNIIDLEARIERDRQIIKDFDVEELFQEIINNNIVDSKLNPHNPKASISKYKEKENEFKSACLYNRQDNINVYISLNFDLIPPEYDSTGSVSKVIFMVSRGKLCLITNKDFREYDNNHNLKNSIVVENKEQLPSLIIQGIKNPTKTEFYRS